MLEVPAYPAAYLPGGSISPRKLPIVLAVGCSLGLLLALYLSHQAGLFRIAFPVAAALVGLVLLINRPVAYVQYTLWIWFVTPFVRRFIDWKFGFADPNLVLVAPLAVAGVSVYTLLRKDRRELAAIPFTFLFCLVAIVYGFAVGMLTHASAEVGYGLLNWSCPLLFGLHLYLTWPSYQQHRDAIRRTFVMGILLMGIYGIYQYVVAPDWEAYWLNNLYSPYDIAPSFGLPRPYEIRIWSTMNAPGPYADVLMVGLLLLIGMKSRFKIASSILGYINLLLTSVRTAWLGWLVGFALILGNTRPKVLIRALLSAVLFVVCLVVVAKTLPFFPQLSDRIDTFTDLKSDSSVSDRTAMYRAISSEAFGNPFGRGLNNQTDFHGYMIDSGILLIVFSFGWFGSVAFAVGVIALVAKFGKRNLPAQPDEFFISCRAICVALLVQLVGGNIFIGVIGAMFWMCAGLFLAAQSFNAQKATEPAIPPVPSGTALTPSQAVEGL